MRTGFEVVGHAGWWMTTVVATIIVTIVVHVAIHFVDRLLAKVSSTRKEKSRLNQQRRDRCIANLARNWQKAIEFKLDVIQRILFSILCLVGMIGFASSGPLLPDSFFNKAMNVFAVAAIIGCWVGFTVSFFKVVDGLDLLSEARRQTRNPDE